MLFVHEKQARFSYCVRERIMVNLFSDFQKNVYNIQLNLPEYLQQHNTIL